MVSDDEGKELLLTAMTAGGRSEAIAAYSNWVVARVRDAGEQYNEMKAEVERLRAANARQRQLLASARKVLVKAAAAEPVDAHALRRKAAKVAQRIKVELSERGES